MTSEQIKLLHKMKELISKGYRKFAFRKDRDYVQELLDIGITIDDAWNEILTLSSNNYFPDYNYFNDFDRALVFKKCINGYIVYIKLKIEIYFKNEMTVCLSFHIDHK